MSNDPRNKTDRTPFEKVTNPEIELNEDFRILVFNKRVFNS